MSNVTGSGAEEKEPVIYVRHFNNASYCWSAIKTDVDLSNKPMICDCGAKASLKNFLRRNESVPSGSTIVAVGSKIYTFGGVNNNPYSSDGTTLDGYYNIQYSSDEVSCIDTLYPEKGWHMMKNMPTPSEMAYPVTVDGNRVLLVGGLNNQLYVPTTTHNHMYYVDSDTCLPLSNDFNLPLIDGHGVVNVGGEIYVLMHSYSSPGLFAYDVGKDCWKHHWQNAFDDHSHASALVDGIYYVLDVSVFARNRNLYFSGYDITLDDPDRLPVEVTLDQRKENERWMPAEDAQGRVATATLLSLGNSKLAMVWHCACRVEFPSVTRVSVWCSILKMTKMKDDSGGLKLVALPLSNTCYHLEGEIYDGCVLVYPSKALDNLNSCKRKRID